MTDSAQITAEDATHALDDNVDTLAREGYVVHSGCSVTINGSGTLGSGNNAISVASGEIYHDQTSVDVSSQNVDIDTGDSNPRKDVVYLDGNGSANVVNGTPQSANPSGFTRFKTREPYPDDFDDQDGVVLAEVWVPADASSIGSNDLNDRRQFSDESKILASSSITLTGDSTPAAETTLAGVTNDQLRGVDSLVRVDSDPSFDADYAFNWDHSQKWDDSDSEVDLTVTINWDTDPGSSNDISATVYALQRDV